MRLILAAIAALTALALPAQAQRLDTRRLNIVTDDHHTECGFNAYPELKLVYTRSGTGAAWVKAADGAPLVRLNLVAAPAPRDWKRPDIVVLLLNGPFDPSIASVASGQLRVEGAAPAALRFGRKRDTYTLTAARDGDETAYAMIDRPGAAEIDLMDGSGSVVRTYRFDTSRLADAVETVSVVKWSCTTP